MFHLLSQLSITAPVGQPSLSVNRFCARTPQQADDHCKEKGFTFCGSCASDECNGAAQYKPIAIMVAISVAAAKIFLFWNIFFCRLKFNNFSSQNFLQFKIYFTIKSIAITLIQSSIFLSLKVSNNSPVL